MGWENNSTFQLLIVTGGGGGLFVYSGAPALGNPPVFAVVAPGVTHDPLGNAVVSILTVGNLAGAFTQIDGSGEILMFNTSGAETIAISPVNQGIFIYSASAALGTLASSDVPSTVTGTDPFGNLFLPGKTEYKKITGTDWQALQMNAGSLNYWTAASPAGPWSLKFSISLQPDEVGLLFAGSGGGQVVMGEALAMLEVSGGVNVLDTGIVWAGGATGDSLALSKAGGNPLLHVTNTSTAGTSLILVELPVVAGQEIAFSTRLTTDSNGRLTLNLDGNDNPRISMGGGSGAPDAIFYRASAGLFASNDIAHDNGGVAEAWNAVTFANGWTNAGLEPGMQFRLVAAPDNCVQVVGSITVPAGFAAGQNITTAMPAAYRPAKVNELTVYNANTNAPARITVTTGGIFQYQAGGNAAGNTLIIPAGNLIALTA